MSESTKPKLCDECKLVLQGKRHRAHCHMFPITCTDQRDLWDDGFRAAIMRVREMLSSADEGLWKL